MILLGEKIVVDKYGTFDQSQGNRQIRPDSYTWYVEGYGGGIAHEWLAHFVDSYGIYHTTVKLPREAFSRSWLQVYFDNLDNVGGYERIAFQLDMSEYDWSV